MTRQGGLAIDLHLSKGGAELVMASSRVLLRRDSTQLLSRVVRMNWP